MPPNTVDSPNIGVGIPGVRPDIGYAIQGSDASFHLDFAVQDTNVASDPVQRLNAHIRDLTCRTEEAEWFRKTMIQQLIANGHDADVLAAFNALELIQYVIEITGGFFHP